MLKCVVVDDEYEIRKGICLYFPWDSVGFEIAADFENATDALEYIRKHSVDAVMTDIRMPDMNGLDFIWELQQSGIDIPVVIVSGYRDFEYARQAMSMGVKHYIVKPARIKDLQTVFTAVAAEIRAKSIDGADGKKQQPDASESERADIVRRIQHYMSRHYQEATLISMADYVKVSPFYLSTVYHQTTGEKLSDALSNIRMKKAGELLSETNMRISEVGQSVGYDLANSFARAFRQYYGMSPKEYRARGKGESHG